MSHSFENRAIVYSYSHPYGPAVLSKEYVPINRIRDLMQLETWGNPGYRIDHRKRKALTVIYLQTR